MLSADTSTPKVFYAVMQISSKKLLTLVLKLFGMLHGLPKSARIGKDVYVNIRMLGAVTKWGINRNHL